MLVTQLGTRAANLVLQGPVSLQGHRDAGLLRVPTWKPCPTQASHVAESLPPTAFLSQGHRPSVTGGHTARILSSTQLRRKHSELNKVFFRESKVG